MDKFNTIELVNQRLSAHDLKGAIELAVADADETKSIAQDAIASLDERLDRLNKQADAALSKYKLLACARTHPMTKPLVLNTKG
jgi:hypothetical protein